MPIKKRPAKRREYPITPQAIAAFRAGDRTGLHRSLGVRPWQVSPIDALGPCPWPDGTAGAASWALSSQLLAELAAANVGGVDAG